MTTETKAVRCDMRADCEEPVTHIDSNGFVYCTDHGIQRRDWKPCRKLRPWELRRILSGRPLSRY